MGLFNVIDACDLVYGVVVLFLKVRLLFFSLILVCLGAVLPRVLISNKNMLMGLCSTLIHLCLHYLVGALGF
jgi:hypothetical protein